MQREQAGKDVAQLGMQSKQSIEPLVIEDESRKAQGDPIVVLDQLEEFLASAGMTKEQLRDESKMPKLEYDIF